MTRWRETEKELGGFLSRHGEPPRPQYPVTALYHRHLWDFDGLERVPPAHRDAPFVSLARTQPLSGLPAAVYNLIRYSGEARVAAVATPMDKYLEGADCDAVLLDAGLADAEIADDEDPSDFAVGLAVSPLEHRPCVGAAVVGGVDNAARRVGHRDENAHLSFLGVYRAMASP